MVENIKRVNNPLTIIALFAGLAEVAGTVAFINVSAELQSVFLWYVMLFPILLVTLFFLTLNLNPSALYAPSDYKNEEYFIEAMKLNGYLDDIESDVQQVPEQILNKLKESRKFDDANLQMIRGTISNELQVLKQHVSQTKLMAEDLTTSAAKTQTFKGGDSDIIEKKILALVARKGSVTTSTLLTMEPFAHYDSELLKRSLFNLCQSGLISKSMKFDGDQTDAEWILQ